MREGRKPLQISDAELHRNAAFCNNNRSSGETSHSLANAVKHVCSVLYRREGGLCERVRRAGGGGAKQSKGRKLGLVAVFFCSVEGRKKEREEKRSRFVSFLFASLLQSMFKSESWTKFKIRFRKWTSSCHLTLWIGISYKSIKWKWRQHQQSIPPLPAF